MSTAVAGTVCGDPCWDSPRLAKFTEALSSEPEVPLMGLSPRHQTERLQEETEEECGSGDRVSDWPEECSRF